MNKNPKKLAKELINFNGTSIKVPLPVNQDNLQEEINKIKEYLPADYEVVIYGIKDNLVMFKLDDSKVKRNYNVITGDNINGLSVIKSKLTREQSRAYSKSLRHKDARLSIKEKRYLKSINRRYLSVRDDRINKLKIKLNIID